MAGTALLDTNLVWRSFGKGLLIDKPSIIVQVRVSDESICGKLDNRSHRENIFHVCSYRSHLTGAHGT